MSDTPERTDERPDAVSIPRRDALKTLGTAAALPLLGERGVGDVASVAQQAQAPAGPRGTPTDPDLIHPTPGTWPRLLSDNELATIAVLCDTIIPADEKSPSASAVGVPVWINEYVSAPYDGQQRALVQLRGGLLWLDRESEARFGKRFGALADAERRQICDEICYLPKARPEHQAAARFFDMMRDLTAVGFYTTREGMRDLDYMGNVPLAEWKGAPPEVLKYLGLSSA